MLNHKTFHIKALIISEKREVVIKFSANCLDDIIETFDKQLPHYRYLGEVV